MDSITTAMTTAFTSIVEDLESALSSIAPVVLPLVGVGLVVTLGVRFFKRIASAAA